jgi:hypothetical protein
VRPDPPPELRIAWSGILWRDVRPAADLQRKEAPAVSLLVLILLILLIAACLPSWPYSRGWGYYPAGGLGLLLVVLVVLALAGLLPGVALR